MGNSSNPLDSEARKESRAIRKWTRLVVGVVIVALGLGIGWLGGKALNRSISHAPAATDLPANESAPVQQPQPGTQSPSKDNTQGSQPPAQKSDQPSAPGSQPQSDAPPPPTKPESKESPKPPDIPDPEQASKEVGRKALKKMMKEINNASGNSNSAKKAKNTNANENRE